MNIEIQNARIVSTKLGKDEERGCLTAIIELEGCNWHSNYILSFLDTWDMIDAEYKSYTPEGYKSIVMLMKSIGVNSWEELVGTYVRVELDVKTHEISRIGHILWNRWFDWNKFYEAKIS